MVRKPIALMGAVVLGGALLSSVPAPASAVAGTVVVSGHDLAPAGLSEFSINCSTFDAPPEPSRLSRAGGTAGSHAIGWQYAGTGNEAGLLAPVASPDTLSTFGVDVLSPTSHMRGEAIAIYYETTPAYFNGYWIGFSDMATDNPGWRSFDLASRTYDWQFIGTTTEPDYFEDMTIQAFAATDTDPGARGGYLGFALGCDGEAFYADNLRVSDAVNQVSYDFEGVPTGARLRWWNGKKAKDGDLAVGYGSKFYLLADSYEAAGFFVGTGTLYQKTRGKSSFVPVANGTYTVDRYAEFKVKPKRETTYWFATSGTDTYEASAANTINVQVGSGLSGRVLDSSIKVGQRAAIKGKVKPGDRGTKVSLQRRVGSRWATIAAGKSGRGGAFKLSAPARSPGTMVLRVVVRKSKDNLGTVSNSVAVRVTRRSSGGGGGNDGGNDGGGSGTSTQPTSLPTTTQNAPDPDDASHRIKGRPIIKVNPAPSAPLAAPQCTMPGPYPVPCAPNESD